MKAYKDSVKLPTLDLHESYDVGSILRIVVVESGNWI